MSGVEPTKIDFQGLKMISEDETQTIALKMDGTSKGVIIDYDLTTLLPKQFKITKNGFTWTSGIVSHTTGLERLALVETAFQAVVLPPNATTIRINDTIELNDGTNNALIGIDGGGNLLIDPSLNLIVNGTLDMSNNDILQVGKLGVGTATPAYNLDVVNQTSGLVSQFTSYSNDTFGSFLMRKARGTSSVPLPVLNGDRIGGIVGYGWRGADFYAGGAYQVLAEADFSSPSSMPTALSFQTTALGATVRSEKVRITGSGNVGIGTSSPTEKLNISGGNLLMGGTFDGMLMNPGSGAGSLAISRSGNFINNVQQIVGTPDYTDNVGSGSGGGAQISLLKNEMSFSTFPTGTVGLPITLTERMRITSTGVGINTTTPSYKLQVEGSGTANEIVGWFNNQGAFSSSIAVRTASKTAYITNHQGLSTPNYTGQLSSALAFGVGSGVAPIQFWNGSPSTAKMTLLSTNGNVGIGTNAPALTLDVSGGSIGNSAGDLTLNVNSTGVGGALKVAGGTGVLSATAGGNSGQHLVITINGVVYKIKLELP